MKFLKWLDDHFEESLIAVIICVIACLMMTQIILRSFFHSALSWSDEACRYLFIWGAALGIPFATNKGAHLRMDILPTLIKPLEKPMSVLCDITLLALAVYLFRPGYGVLLQLAKTHQMTATTHIPMYFVYSSMWVGLILSVVRIVEKYIKLLVSRLRSGGGKENAK